MDLINFLLGNRREVLQLTGEHLLLVLVATGAAVAVGVPVGILLTRRPRLERPVLAAANVLQTVPSLALFGFLIPLLGAYGIGRLPAIIALFLYALLPIIRNTFTGINGVDKGIREAAEAMGMTGWQMLTQVELPLALGFIIAGVRVATVISVGTATIAAAIGAGGLGMYIFRGLRMSDNKLILAGAIPAALMALASDFALGRLERALAPGRAERALRTAKWVAATAGVLLLTGTIVWVGRGGVGNRGGRVAVGTKDFTEQVILGELVAQAIEGGTDLAVERRFELGGDLCHRALVAGEIDVYVEYTGTALTTVLKQPPLTDPGEVYRRVKEGYAARFDAEWLPPLGFDNTFAILVRGDEAQRLGLRTISDAARYSPGWRAGFGQDFMSREDGYPGFARTYGLRFAEPPREMDLSLTYRALAGGQVDLIAGDATNGLIDRLGLVKLEDDRRYFPAYEAAPVARAAALRAHPELRAVFDRLAGTISETEMRRMNNEADVEHREIKQVVRDFLARHPEIIKQD